MSKHTPAPWFIGRAVGSAITSVIGDGDSVVCDLYGRTGDTADADARLIAAAPELLEALEYTLNCLKQTDVGTAHYQPAIAAIAKATGGVL